MAHFLAPGLVRQGNKLDWPYLYKKDNFILATFSAGRIIMTISHTICLSTARPQIWPIINKKIEFRHKEDLGGIHYPRPVPRSIASLY